MQPDEKINSSHEARTKTDESLRTERDKTDASLNKTLDESDKATDQAVSATRKIADRNREKVRDEADAIRGSESANEDAIETERMRSDAAIESERNHADATLKRERRSTEKRVRQLLGQERQETDAHLACERQDSDANVRDAVRSLEDEQLAHDKTKSSLLTRDELLAIVSHDMRNPIGAIASCASMLLDGEGGEEIPSATRIWIEFIKRNADAALRLTNDLLDVERTAAGTLELQLSQHNFIELMRKSTENFVRMAAAKSIMLRTIPPVGTFNVCCDGDRIGQVLANLLGNAIKFTPDNGNITLQLEAHDNNSIRVSVKDTGPGIPDDKKLEIFERFSQLHKNDRHGWGLGLYISKKIIEAHNGKLWVDSRVGQGSAFTFIIPR